MEIDHEEIIIHFTWAVHRKAIPSNSAPEIEKAHTKYLLLIDVFPELSTVDFFFDYGAHMWFLKWNKHVSSHKTPATAMARLTTLLTEWIERTE